MTKNNLIKQILFVSFLAVSVFARAQMVDPNSKAYKDAYNTIMQMMQPGNTVNYNDLNKVYQGLYDEAEKETKRYFNSLKELNYNHFFDYAEVCLKKEDYINALENYNIAVSYMENEKVLNSKGISLFRLGDYKKALECFNKALQYTPNDSNIINNVNITKSKLDLVQKFPFRISDVKIANTDYDGNIIKDYGKVIYADNVMYLKTKIILNASKSGKANLKVKIYDNTGKLRKGNDSPEGFTFSDDKNYTLDTKEIVLVGWGNNEVGHWNAGNYRFEIWSGDLCLAIKEIYIPNIAASASSTFFVPFYSTQTNFNTSNSNLKSKTCSYCHGTGIDPYPSYVSSYGNDRTSNNRCDICGKYEIHYHKRCISCQGKGYIESYF